MKQIFDSTDIAGAASQLKSLRGASPYRFCGTWYLVKVESGVQAFRTKRAASKKALKEGSNTISEVYV